MKKLEQGSLSEMEKLAIQKRNELGLKDTIGSFIAGYETANESKYVEREKLKFAIEQLKEIKIAISDKNPFTLYSISNKIIELEQQLKELEK